MMGVPYDFFWTLNPRKLKVFEEAYKLKLKEKNMMYHLEGQYMMSALSATIGNMFKRKGAKLIEYPNEPFDIFGEKKIEIHEDMTENEKQEVRLKFMESLEKMQANFEKAKGKQ